MILLSRTLALMGCTGSSDASQAVPQDTGSADTAYGDTAPEDSSDTDFSGETEGNCDGHGAGETVAFTSVYGGNVASETYTNTVDARVFDTEAEWLAFLGGMTLEGDVGAIDFASQRVVAGFVVVPNTCGLIVGDIAVTQKSGEAVHVDFTVTDTSGACDTQCSAMGQALVAVAVARDAVGEPSVCTRREDGGC